MKDHKNIKLWRDIIFVISGILLLIIGSTILSLGVYTASESDSYLINIPIFLITAVVLLLLYNLLIRYVEANDACKIAPRKDISSIGNGLFIGFSYFIIVTVTMSLCGYYHIKKYTIRLGKTTLLLYIVLPCSCIRRNFLQRYPLPYDKQTMEHMGCIGYFSINFWWIAYTQRQCNPLVVYCYNHRSRFFTRRSLCIQQKYMVTHRHPLDMELHTR